MGRFLARFTNKNQFLFHESKLLFQNIHYPKNYPPSTLGSSVVVAGRQRPPPSDNFLGALKFVIADVKYDTIKLSPACQQVQR